jgi:hypothetical protein
MQQQTWLRKRNKGKPHLPSSVTRIDKVGRGSKQDDFKTQPSGKGKFYMLGV